MQYSKDDRGCLCFTYRFEVASLSPIPDSTGNLQKEYMEPEQAYRLFPSKVNPTSIRESAAQGLSEIEASKKLLYLVAVNRPTFHQFHLMLFGGYLYFQPFVIMRVLEYLLLLLIREMGVIIPICFLPAFHDTI